MYFCVFEIADVWTRDQAGEDSGSSAQRDDSLKERSCSEQSQEDEGKEADGEESVEELVVHAEREREFFEIMEAKKEEKERDKVKEIALVKDVLLLEWICLF